jgi:hypothetical protein
VPFEIVPDDSDGGYRAVQLNPVFDPTTRTTTFVMKGYSPNPTVEDGYHLTATVEVGPTGGAAVIRLEIEPSRTIAEKEDVHRPRLTEEKRLSPINSSTLALLRFTEILNRIVEIESTLSGFLADSPVRQVEIQQRMERLRERRPRKDPATAAEHAEQALAAMQDGRGYQARLSDEWGIGVEGVKKRISRLRADDWLHGDYGKPGDRLTKWRDEQHGANSTTKE